jgi:hypothetical protein
LPVTRQATIRTKPVTEREITVKFKLKKLLVPALVFGALVVVGLIWRAGRVRDAGPASGRAFLPEKGTFVIPSETRDIQVKTGIEPPAAPAAPEGDETAGRHFSVSGKGATSAIMGYLAPFMKDPAKFMGEKDALELEKALGEIKAKYPKEAAALSQWLDNIQVRITEGKKQKEAGNLEASRKSYDRGESEMRKLLAQVSERERAEEAFRQLEDAKKRISRTALRDRPNLLSWIALEKEKDASDAFAKNDFSGARILCGILTRVHLLSPKAADETAGLAALRDLTASIRAEAGAASAPQKQAWLYERAKAEEDGAGEKAREGLVPQAAEQYVLAAFLYEKAKEVALESAGAGRD